MLHYLTVQDILWINHEVTKKVNEYKFAQLEEATFFQYGYGKSEDVLGQAGTFIEGFMKLRPFASGNKATAFVSTLSFLKLNNVDVNLEPAAAATWAKAIAEKEMKGVDAIKSISSLTNKPSELKPAVRTDVHEIIEAHQEAIDALAD